MASVWFSVLVFLSAQLVFARDCSDLGSLRNCDECIRCGGDWCTDPGIDEARCSRDTKDWCPSSRATVPVIEPYQEPGVGPTINPRYVTRTIRVGKTTEQSFDFAHTTGKPQVEVTFVNSTVFGLNKNFETKIISSQCHSGSCIAEVMARPDKDFCPVNGGEEFVTLEFRMDKETASLKYHVPCACACSQEIERNSAKCNKHGDYSCGLCSCHTGWQGKHCETSEDCDRGDISGCFPPNSNLKCSNNGHCRCGGTCECFTDKPGYQYFDEQCSDICTTSSYCDSCIRHPEPGPCNFCHFSMIVERFNRSLMGERDELGRPVWIECTEPTEDCQIKYAAMKDRYGDTHVMVIDLCQPIVASAAVASFDITIPVVLGVIALVAVAAAAAGFTMYKKASPPVPLDPRYQNIGAEDCTGENPLYKPPTSSFKNPTYGKW